MHGLPRSSTARHPGARATGTALVAGVAVVGPVASPGTVTGASTARPSSTELPEQGNTTGPDIGPAAAGVLGVLLVHRLDRRARALAAGSSDDA